MTTAAIRKKLVDYLQTADEKKVKAIYTMVENDIDEATGWDKEFIEELDKRNESFLDGSAKMYTLEEAKQAARKKLKTNRK